MRNGTGGGREPDESAPAIPTADDPTERHLLKARELLREARSRLTARDDEAIPPSADSKTPANDPEER